MCGLEKAVVDIVTGGAEESVVSEIKYPSAALARHEPSPVLLTVRGTNDHDKLIGSQVSRAK